MGAMGQQLLTDALPAHVLLVPHVALAAVAGWGGDAASVQAEVSEMLADVNGLIQSGSSWKAPETALGRGLQLL